MSKSSRCLYESEIGDFIKKEKETVFGTLCDKYHDEAGMVICVPEGNKHKTRNGFWEDNTRLPEYYEGSSGCQVARKRRT